MNFDKSTLQLEASASIDADVCVGRCGCLRRSVRMSASVGADVCVGRCGTCLIILLASTNSNKNRKEQNFDIEVLLFSLVGCKWSTLLVHFKEGTLRGCTCPKCTNQDNGAPPKTTWLVHLRQVHPKTTRLVHLRQVHPLKLHGWCT